MVQKKSWKEFRKSGLVLIINQILHIFGWAICFKIDSNGNVKDVYPARVRFRGFDNKNTSEAYQKVSQYMKNNVDDLLKESKE